MLPLRNFLNSIFGRILDLLLPRSTLVMWLEKADTGMFSARARKAGQNLPGVVSLFDYRDPLVKELIWEIKFKGNRRLATLAASLLYEHLLAELGDRVLFGGVENPILIPVPLAPKRLRERGFNQCERIAEELCRIDGGASISLSNAIRRVKETQSQTRTQSRAERLQNLRGAFAITDSKSVAGKHIIVLDDVTTTGTTIGEIKKVLLAAGAESVTGLTLAH